MIVLLYDEPSPSLNRLLRGHWAKNHKIRNKWLMLTRAAKGRAGFWDRPKWQKASIRIERYGARILDTDNARGGLKFLTDSLVREGIIADDTPAVIGEPVIVQHAGRVRGTVVRIEPA